MSIYDQLKNAGCELDSHESDLYVRATQAATEILNQFAKKEIRGDQRSKLCRSRILVFTDQQGQLWYEIPFAYDPFWTAKAKPPTGTILVDCRRLDETETSRGNVIAK